MAGHIIRAGIRLYSHDGDAASRTCVTSEQSLNPGDPHYYIDTQLVSSCAMYSAHNFLWHFAFWLREGGDPAPLLSFFPKENIRKAG